MSFFFHCAELLPFFFSQDVLIVAGNLCDTRLGLTSLSYTVVSHYNAKQTLKNTTNMKTGIQESDCPHAKTWDLWQTNVFFRHRNALMRALTTLKAPTWDFTMNLASSKGRMAIEYSGPQKVNTVIPYDCTLFSWEFSIFVENHRTSEAKL